MSALIQRPGGMIACRKLTLIRSEMGAKVGQVVLQATSDAQVRSGAGLLFVAECSEKVNSRKDE